MKYCFTISRCFKTLTAFLIAYLLLVLASASLSEPAQTDMQVQSAIKAANRPLHASKLKGTDLKRLAADNVKKMNLRSPSERSSLLVRMLTAISDWIDGLFQRAPKLGPAGAVILTIIQFTLKVLAYIVVIAAGAVLLFALYKLLRSWLQLESAAPSDQPVPELEISLEPKGSFASSLAAADNLRAQGDYVRALRQLYFAALTALISKEIISYSKDKTNRDYLRTVRKNSTTPAYDSFRSVTSLFDTAVYGGRAVTAADYDSARTSAVKLEENLGR